MSIKKFFKIKNDKLYWLILAVVILIVGGALWQGGYFNQTTTEEPIQDARITCKQDSDCELVSQYESCCPKGCTEEAVNVETKKRDEEARNKQYLCSLKKYACPKYNCVSSVAKQAVCEQNRCVVKEKQLVNVNTDNNITISLDKTYYQKGETVNITIKNNGINEIIISNIAMEKYSVNQNESGFNQWVVIDSDINCLINALCEKVVNIISTGSNKTFPWEQYSDKFLGGKTDSGKYRAKIDYIDYYEDDGKVGINKASETIYSNEFEIKYNINKLDHSNYKIIGLFTSPGESSFVKALGDTVYLTDISEGLLAIDVSNPEKPVLLDKIKIGNGGAYALAVNSNGPFAVASGYGNSKVALVDIRDPKNLQIFSEVDAKRTVQDIVMVADYVYLAIDGPEVEVLKRNLILKSGITFTSKGVFQIQGGGHTIGTAVLRIDKGDSVTYNLIIAQGESGVGVYKKAEFIMPQFSFVSNAGYVNIVDADENYVYAGVGNGIKVIDLKTQKEIVDIKVDDVWNFKVKDKTLYVASGENGVKVLDISDIKNPKQIALIDTPGRARSIDVSANGKYIYVVDDRDDLQIIEIK